MRPHVLAMAVPVLMMAASCLAQQTQPDLQRATLFGGREIIPKERADGADHMMASLCDGKESDAVAAIDAYLKDQPDDQDYLFLKGVILRSRDEKEKAKTCFQQAVAADRDSPVGQCAFVMIKVDEGERSSLALGKMNDAIHQAPENLSIQWASAMAYHTAGRNMDAYGHASAVAKYNNGGPVRLRNLLADLIDWCDPSRYALASSLRGQVIKLEPDAWSYEAGARTLVILERFDDAQIVVSQALDRDQSYAPTWKTMAEIAYVKGDYAKAETIARRAVELDSQSIGAHMYLGMALRKLGKQQESHAEFLTAAQITVPPTKRRPAKLVELEKLTELPPDVAYEEMLKYIYAGRGNEVDNLMQKLATDNPDRQDALFLSALFKYPAAPQHDAALKMLNHIVEIDASTAFGKMSESMLNVDAHTNVTTINVVREVAMDHADEPVFLLAATMTANKTDETARQALDLYDRLNRMMDSGPVVYHVQFARALDLEGDRERAVVHGELAFDRSPTPDTHQNLAVLFAHLGLFGEAETEITAATTLDPKTPTRWLAWASLEYQRKHYAESVEKAKKAMEIEPGNTNAFNGIMKTLGVLSPGPERDRIVSDVAKFYESHGDAARAASIRNQSSAAP